LCDARASMIEQFAAGPVKHGVNSSDLVSTVNDFVIIL
jgi:hypothetical protein